MAIAGLHGMELGEKKLMVQRYKSGLAQEAMDDGITPGTIVMAVLVQANEPVQPTEVLVIINAVDTEALDHDDYYQGKRDFWFLPHSSAYAFMYVCRCQRGYSARV